MIITEDRITDESCMVEEFEHADENEKIIVDTSIWIEFLKNSPIIFPRMQALLEDNNVIGVEFIFGELLQGAKTIREKDIINLYWQCLPKADESSIWLEAGDFSSENMLLNKGVGLIDCAIIVLSIRNNFKVWTLDKKLKSVLASNQIYEK